MIYSGLGRNVVWWLMKTEAKYIWPNIKSQKRRTDHWLILKVKSCRCTRKNYIIFHKCLNSDNIFEIWRTKSLIWSECKLFHFCLLTSFQECHFKTKRYYHFWILIKFGKCVSWWVLTETTYYFGFLIIVFNNIWMQNKIKVSKWFQM